MIKIDIHQHLWTEPLVQALAERRELPFVRHERGLTVLFLAGERPYVIDLSDEAPTRRAALVELDGLDRALLCLSSPLGIESLPREQSLPLIDAYHDGVLSLDGPFGVWGAIALDRPDPDDVDRVIGRGCVGLSLPAGRSRQPRCLLPPAPSAGACGAARSPTARPPRARGGRAAGHGRGVAGRSPVVAGANPLHR